MALGLTALAIVSQMAGLMAQGGRGLLFGFLIPFSCAFIVGARNYLGLWTYVFVALVGVSGPHLVDIYGYEEPSTDAYINLVMIPWVLAPLLLACAGFGMLFRLGSDAWADRRE